MVNILFPLILAIKDSVKYRLVSIGSTGRWEVSSSPMVIPWQYTVGILFCLTKKNPLVYFHNSSTTPKPNLNFIPKGR